jgi:hypothetical protein
MTAENATKWELAIRKLLEYTQDNRLRWQIANPREYLPKADTKDAVMLVNYENKILLLYREAEMKHETNEYQSFYNRPSDKEKVYKTKLSIYDEKSKVIVYDFPANRLIADLYRAASFNAANVDDFLDRIIESKPKEKKDTNKR